MKYDYVFFVGTGHSGSTIISTILHAHPNISISEEWKMAGKLLRKVKTVKQIHRAMLNPSKGVRRTALLDSLGNPQNTKGEIKILGDKSPWDLVNVWRRSAGSNIFEELENMLEGKVKIIITIRDPYQHLPGYFNSKKHLRNLGSKDEVMRVFVRYLARAYDAASYAVDHADCLVVANEDLIQDPQEVVEKIYNFVGVKGADELISQLQEIIYRVPDSKEYDFDVKWKNVVLKDQVEERIINKFKPMERYSRNEI